MGGDWCFPLAAKTNIALLFAMLSDQWSIGQIGVVQDDQVVLQRISDWETVSVISKIPKFRWQIERRSFDVNVFSKCPPGVWRDIVLFRLGEAVRCAIRRVEQKEFSREEIQEQLQQAASGGNFNEVIRLSAILQ